MGASDSAAAKRLMLALDAGRCAAADISLAIDLAALIGAELQGLFVEDSDLLRLAALPFAREVGGRSGQHRPMERSAVESMLKRRVERVAGELERAGKQRNIAVSHRTARGKMVRQALEHGRHGDVVLLHPTTRAKAATATRATLAALGPVMVWYDAPAAAASLEVAIPLARRSGAQVLVGFPSLLFGSDADARSALGAWLTQASVPVRMRRVADASAAALIDAARAARAVQLIVCGEGVLSDTAMLERLLGELSSDLILIR